MFRLASRTTFQRYGLTTARHQSTTPPSRGSGLGKKLFLTTTLLGGAAGGAIGYAYVDPEFRNKIEENVPQSKELFQTLLGPPRSGLTPKASGIASLTSLRKAPIEHKEHVPEPTPAPVKPAVSSPKPPVEVTPVDVKKPVIPSGVPEVAVNAEVENKRLEDRIKAAIQSAEAKVKVATDAKLKTIQAIDEHARALKKAVDDGPKAQWESVSVALGTVDKHASCDAKEEIDSRNYLDNLSKIVNDGKSITSTASNPLLVNATETVNKLSSQLDELNMLVEKSRSESRVFNKYKDLIDQSRRQFSSELKAILPNIDINAKNAKLSEDDLNALIAHAHLRVDQLRRQLAEQQLFEEQHIAKAIEDQRLSDERIAANQLTLEVDRVKKQGDVEVEKQLLVNRRKWETELEDRLRLAAAAHSEHIEQVVRTQKQLHDIENAQAVEEAVNNERKLHQKQVELALSKLGGIETALNSRVALDAENRKSKQYWIACQNLIESIVYGKKAGDDIDARRKPLAKEAEVIREAFGQDAFVDQLLHTFPEQSLTTGVYTEQDLKNRFNTIYKLSHRTAMIDENGGGILKYFSSYVQSLLTLELPRRFTEGDKFDTNVLDTYEILARARYFVQKNDLLSATKMMQLLNGEPGRIAKDWIKDVRTHLETRVVAELLLAHAAVTSIRSTY
uniref:MICOS complex subunit MIC60 n=1 Tax=Steinernema glaseri TaxID=37863 RepID=A0A1I7ZU12_9BILA